MKKTILTLATLVGMTSSIYAGCTSDKCTDVDITRMFMTSYGSIVIGTSGDESKLNCTAPGNANVTLRNTDVGKNAIYSYLLTAKTTKSKVTIRIVEGSNGCDIGYVY